MKKENLEIREKIIALKKAGHKRRQILIELNISRNQYVNCYLSDDKIERRHKLLKEYRLKRIEKDKEIPYGFLIRKIYNFHAKNLVLKPFTYLDVIKKFGEKPNCYLTGEMIDLNNIKDFHFEHIIPSSKGGSNELENLQLAKPYANQMKSNFSLDELINHCYNIIKHNKPELLK